MCRDDPRRFAAVFGFCAGHFHAEGRPIACAFDILGVCDGNILPFDVRIVSVFGEEAVFAHIEMDVAVGGVDGVDDEVAVALLEGNAVFRSRSEDALPCQLRLLNRSFAGFKNDLLIRCQRDAGDIACRFKADFIARLESAVLRYSAFGNEINRAFVCGRLELAFRFRINRADGRHLDGIFIYYGEIPALCSGESQKLLTGKPRHVREVDGHAILLLSDTPLRLARSQGDSLAGDVRCAFQRGIRICDAFLDAARCEGDKEILRRLRRTDKGFCFFIFREEFIFREIVFAQCGVPVDALSRALDAIGVVLHFFGGPAADAFCKELLIARLLFFDVGLHILSICLKLPAGHIIETVLAVCIDVRPQGLELIILAFDFGDEVTLLFVDGRLTAFEDRRIRPAEELRRSILVIEIGVVVVDEGTIRLQADIAFLGNDTVKVQVAAGIFDRNMSFRAGFEPIVFALALTCFDEEAAICALDSATGSELDATRVDFRPGLLRDVALGLDRSRTCGDAARGDAMVHDLDAEVFRRAAADGHSIRLDGRIPRASAARRRRHSERIRIDVTACALLDTARRKRRFTKAIGNRPIHDDVSRAAIDIELATGFIADETDTDIIVRLLRVLMNGRIVFLFHQLVVKFLRQPHRVPEAFRLLREDRLGFVVDGLRRFLVCIAC